MLVYKMICHCIFRTVVPLVALIVLNGRLICALRAARRRQRERRRGTAGSNASGGSGGKKGSGGHRENLTLMLISVVTVFIICELPDAGLRLFLFVVELSWPEYLERMDLVLMQHANAFANM